MLNLLLDDEHDPGSSQVLDSIEAGEAYVPMLWHWEVRNAIIMAERRGRISAEQALRHQADITALPIAIDIKPDWPRTMELARTHGLTVYDASYLALALSLGVQLATLDRALARAATAESVLRNL